MPVGRELAMENGYCIIAPGGNSYTRLAHWCQGIPVTQMVSSMGCRARKEAGSI